MGGLGGLIRIRGVLLQNLMPQMGERGLSKGRVIKKFKLQRGLIRKGVNGERRLIRAFTDFLKTLSLVIATNISKACEETIIRFKNLT